jgi:hypothetical protein
MANQIWKPTATEIDRIWAKCQTHSYRPLERIEAGLRMDDESDTIYLNHALIKDYGSSDLHDLLDIGEVKEVPLTADGRATLDLYVYDDNDLITNVEVTYANGVMKV